MSAVIPDEVVEARAVRDAAKYGECHEGVFRGDRYEPCEKPTVAIRRDRTFGGVYPVCARHARGDVVPLVDVLAAVTGTQP